MSLPSTASESARQLLLRKYGILDSEQEAVYDDLASLAASICKVPIAAVTFFDGERQWFKSAIGAPVSEAPMAHSFCTYTTLDPDELFVVEDASQDERFAGAPHVTGEPFLRAYAGAALLDPTGVPLGTICVFDVASRTFSEVERQTLRVLSRQVVYQLQLRKRLRELEQLNIQLHAVNEELDQFGYIVSHDLKAPIRQQSAYAEIVLEDYGDKIPQGARDLLGQIPKIGEKAGMLLDDLNTYLHSSALRGESAGTASLRDICSSFDGLMDKPQHGQLQLELGSCAEVEVSAAPIRHILANLIGNAFKYNTSDSAIVQVLAKADPFGLILEVHDNGFGIDPKEREQVFQLFGRGEAAEGTSGRGLGLAICKRLVQGLDGTIEINDSPLGGACFRVYIPA